MGSLLATQLTQLAGDLHGINHDNREDPVIRDTTAGRGTLERASGMLKDLSKELDKPKAASALGAGMPKSGGLAPVPVESVSLIQALWKFAKPYFPTASSAGNNRHHRHFCHFHFASTRGSRNRLIRLAGSHDLQRTTAALDDAARRSVKHLIQLR